MRFITHNDKLLFAAEIGINIITSNISEDWKPSDEILEEFVKKRKNFVGKIKDFRKSQNTKKQWREKRREMMTSIKGFHKSTDGKKFHRSLGRFLATRITRGKNENSVNFLKGLLSLRTSLYIEEDTYKPTSEDVDFMLLKEEAFDVLLNIEVKANKFDFSLEEQEEDMLSRLIDPKVLLGEIFPTIECNQFRKVIDTLDHIINSYNVSYLEAITIASFLTESEEMIKSFAKKYDKPIEAIEKTWKEAEKILIDQGVSKDSEKFYPMLVHIFKNKIKNEDMVIGEVKTINARQEILDVHKYFSGAISSIAYYAKANRVTLNTDMKGLEKQILSSLIKMNKDNKKTKILRSDDILKFLKKSVNNEGFNGFKDELLNVLNSLVKILIKKRSTDREWIDIGELIRPLASIEYKEK